MFYRQILENQINYAGLRLGDSCQIIPVSGKRKILTMNRTILDIVSAKYRPQALSMSFIELPQASYQKFHYRLEIDQKRKEGRFVLKTLEGEAFWLNGLAVKEAYVERLDRLYIDDNRISFSGASLGDLTQKFFDHSVLSEKNLIESNLSLLIQGETGTGKSHLAEKIHEKSQRTGKFISINLSSLNPQLIESELFGHIKGAFTGAIKESPGAFSLADQGTLFLDEVDSLPIDIQTKLLTFLDSQKFRKVGDMKELKINARLIFASGRSLEALVSQGVFRKDFYYRLRSGHFLELKSLRNDPKKIIEACQFYSLQNNLSLSVRLIEFYQTLVWPGNLRQLFGHLNKKKVLSKSTKLDFDGLDEELMLESSDLMNLSDRPYEIVPFHEYKENYIKRIIGICDGSVSLAAKHLQLSERVVRNVYTKRLVGKDVGDF